MHMLFGCVSFELRGTLSDECARVKFLSVKQLTLKSHINRVGGFETDSV